MADPNATRRYLQLVGALDEGGRPRRARPRGGIDIEDVTIGAARREAPDLPPAPSETVLDEIEVIGDPNAREGVVEMGEMEFEPSQGVRNVAAALPSFLSEPFSRMTRDTDSTLGRVARRVIDAPLGYAVRDDGSIDEDDPTTIGTLFGNENVEAAQTFGERGADALPLGFGEEIYSGVRGALDPSYRAPRQQETTSTRGLGAPNEEESDRARYLRERSERSGRHPIASTAGTITGSVPAAVLTPAATARTLPMRVAQAGFGNALLGGVQSIGLSEGDVTTEEGREQIGRDALMGTGMGLAFGAGGQLLSEGVGAIGQAIASRRGAPGMPRPGGDFTPEQWAEARARMDAGDSSIFDQMTAREGLEEEAAIRRIRSTADDAAMTDVRRAGDHPGGYRGLARDLDETGISPRGSWRDARAADAQARAARIEDSAGRQIGSVTQRMDDAARSLDADQALMANTDEDLARLTEEARARGMAGREVEQRTVGARGGRARPRPQRVREVESGYEPMTAEEARAAAVHGTDPALVRYSGADDPSRGLYGGTLTTLDDAGRAQHVPGGHTVDRLRAEADEMARAATTPEQRAAAQRLRDLADDFEQIAPERYSQAQRRLHGLDEEAAYGTRYPNAPQAAPDYVARSRSARQGVREDMDLAVERTLGPEALRELQAARARYGAARTVGQLGDRGIERGAANLQAGLGDTIALQSGLSREGPLWRRAVDAVTGVVVNRFLRSSGHAIRASVQETQSDMMARQIVRALAGRPNNTAMAQYLQAALERGPRAFGIALLEVIEREPETAAEIEPVVRAFHDDGSPNWDVVDDVEYAGEQDDGGVGSDVDWSVVPDVQYADEYEEEQRRRQR
jgi:hypothetical protein